MAPAYIDGQESDMAGAALATHAALTTGTHGAGADTLATDANIATHAALTASVHGAGAAPDSVLIDSDALHATRLSRVVSSHWNPVGDSSGTLPSDFETYLWGTGTVAPDNYDSRWVWDVDAGGNSGSFANLYIGDDGGGGSAFPHGGIWTPSKNPEIVFAVDTAEVSDDHNSYAIGLLFRLAGTGAYDAAYLNFDKDARGANWHLITAKASAFSSATDTTIAAASGTWQWWKIAISGTSSVTAYNSPDGRVWTQRAQETTAANIPIQGMCVWVSAENSGGVANSRIPIWRVAARQDS